MARRRKAPKAQLAATKALWDDTWNAVMPSALIEALKPLRESKKSVPGRLLHFTDAAGALGILRGKHLRLSRSRSSNDPLELEFGLGLVRECLDGMSNAGEWTHTFKEEVRNCVRSSGAALPDRPSCSRATSPFRCARDRRPWDRTAPRLRARALRPDRARPTTPSSIARTGPRTHARSPSPRSPRTSCGYRREGSSGERRRRWGGSRAEPLSRPSHGQ